MTTPTEQTNIYKPEGAMLLSELLAEPQIRLGLQGFPGTGKTWAALTFPNPIVINIDRGLGAHTGRSDVIEIPLWDKDYCKRTDVNPNHKDATSLKDTIFLWLDRHGKKLTEHQTLVFDGGTGLQNAYHKYAEANPVVSAQGAYDKFAVWRLKLDYFGAICEMFKTLKCHIVYICHETEKKDVGGEYSGKLRPLLTGQFVDQLSSHFTDWFRCLTTDKVLEDKLDDKKLAMWGLSKKEFLDMQDTFPRNTVYYWQTEGDSLCDCKSSSLVNFPHYIPANYQSFSKYMKKAKVMA